MTNRNSLIRGDSGSHSRSLIATTRRDQSLERTTAVGVQSDCSDDEASIHSTPTAAAGVRESRWNSRAPSRKWGLERRGCSSASLRAPAIGGLRCFKLGLGDSSVSDLLLATL